MAENKLVETPGWSRPEESLLPICSGRLAGAFSHKHTLSLLDKLRFMVEKVDFVAVNNFEWIHIPLWNIF